MIPQHFGDKRYYSLNAYCKQIFGEKIYRLSLDGGMTCPNRDGKLSTGGCTFCSGSGSGDFAADRQLSIYAQIESAKERISKKSDCRYFIAYFQAYTNTYAPISHLRRIFTEALSHPQIVGLSIGTRSDCLADEVLDLLEALSRTPQSASIGSLTYKPIWVELGLQTIHNETHARLNTHTTAEGFDTAVLRLKSRHIPVIAHVILGLPSETPQMMLETVSHLAKLHVDGVKLQLLHILKGTALAEEYASTPFALPELTSYCDLVIDCLELLPPDVVVHRLTGDGPRDLLLAPLWSTDKKRVLNTISKRMKERDTFQGKLYKN